MSILLLYPSKEEDKKIKHRQRDKIRREKNPEKTKARLHDWYVKNRQKNHKERSKKPPKETKKPPKTKKKPKEVKRKEARERLRIWREKNPDKVKEHTKRQWLADPEKMRNNCRNWKEKNPEKARLHDNKSRENRKDLKVIALNDWFPGSQGHHVDKVHIIYIPGKIHKMYYHDHKKPETMVQINKIAWAFLHEVLSTCANK